MNQNAATAGRRRRPGVHESPMKIEVGTVRFRAFARYPGHLPRPKPSHACDYNAKWATGRRVRALPLILPSHRTPPFQKPHNQLNFTYNIDGATQRTVLEPGHHSVQVMLDLIQHFDGRGSEQGNNTSSVRASMSTFLLRTHRVDHSEMGNTRRPGVYVHQDEPSHVGGGHFSGRCSEGHSQKAGH